jgi:predicted DNA-binding antitoxin AbrB/MazE fold protein
MIGKLNPMCYNRQRFQRSGCGKRILPGSIKLSGDSLLKDESMTKTITARYEQGVLVPMEAVGLQEHQVVRLQIVPPRVLVTAATARRKVNRFLLDEVSYLIGGEQPALVEAERLVWRVPVVLTYPDRGVVGQAGFIDVDAESGELLLTPQNVEEIKRDARALAARLSSATTT